MNPHLSILLIIISFPSIVGCSYSQTHQSLDKVASYMDACPDKALEVLQEMSVPKQKALTARYALLYTMALDKNYIDTTDISVIMPAVEYYDHRGSKMDRMKSLFYLGRIQSNAKDYPEAMMSQMKAKSYADEIGNTYWSAMLASALGYTYNLNMCVSGEIECMEKALELWKEYGDSTHITIAMYNLALAYHNNRQFDKSDSLYCILINAGNKEALTFLAGNKLMQDGSGSKTAVDLYSEALADSIPLNIHDYYKYAYALALAGEDDSCQKLLSQLESYPNDLETDYWQSKIAEHRLSYKDAFDYLSAYTVKGDSTVKAQLDQSVYRAQSDYYLLDAQYSETKKREAYLRLIVVCLLSFLALAGIIIVFRRRQKRIQDRNEELSLMYEESQQMIASIRIQEDLNRRQAESELKELETKLFSLRSSFAKLYQSQFDTIARLLENRKDAASHFDAAKEQYASKVAAVLSDIRKGEKGQKEFERMIDSELDGIMTKLRKDYPNFKESDFRVLSYLIVGFDATTRSFILGGTPNNMRVVKSRLLTYIRNHPTENEELYSVFLLS